MAVCCSFECLRFTNFLSHVTLESIQTLLILGNVRFGVNLHIEQKLIKEIGHL